MIADELDAVARAFAPRLYLGCSWAVARWSSGPETSALRHRIADAINDRVKRMAPSLHARAKAAAVDAIRKVPAVRDAWLVRI